MKTFLPLAIVLVLSSGYGVWYRTSRGRIKGKSGAMALVSSADIDGGSFGSRVTLLQFSSAFCQPCRATRRILEEVTVMVPGVSHVEIDAEENLDLVRALDVRRTPTVLFLGPTGDVQQRASGQPRKVDVIAALGRVMDASGDVTI